jgi:hypothetical protein
MSTFWIDDLEAFATLLPELNRRLNIKPGQDYFTEESATVLLDVKRKDADFGALVIHAEKSAEKDGSSWRQRVTLEWNMNYQTVDEVVSDLRTLLGLQDE